MDLEIQSAEQNLTPILIEIFYYICLLVATVMGCSIIYVLIKYAKSKNLAYIVSFAFAIIFIGLAADGISILNKIKTQ